jgi:myo-inositol-1-phosphate synthase
LLTQLGTIRLGRRTENWGTTVKKFVQLPEMDDFVFGGWDAFPE